MDFGKIAQIMLLLAVANGSPVIATRLMGSRLAAPIDFGSDFVDHRRLFGPTKTVRGLVSSVALTSLAAHLIGLSWRVGALIALASMAGDLLSSFIKRRMGMSPSSMAIGLDQCPEALLPALLAIQFLSLTVIDAAFTVFLFFLGEIVLSRMLFRIGIRERPY
jgi:CDP-diglyceride synthetase